jgi:uncharacterized protein
MQPFVVNAAELVRRPGNRKVLHLAGPVTGLVVNEVRIPEDEDVTLDVTIDSMADGLTVDGRLQSRWVAECRRCLAEASKPIDLAVKELFQPEPIAEDAYAFEGAQLDLEPMIRDLLLLELPLAPLCRDECAGLCPVCGVNRNDLDCGHDDKPTDVRWSALESLKLQLDDQ